MKIIVNGETLETGAPTLVALLPSVVMLLSSVS